MIELTALELRALKCMDGYTQWTDPKQVMFGYGLEASDPLRKSYRVWNKLNEKGLVDRADHDSQVRGEERHFWNEYRPNRNGRAYLETLNSTD